MTKYNIIRNTLETTEKNKIYQGCTLQESENQYPETVASFDSLDEAKEALTKYASRAEKWGKYWNVEEYYISAEDELDVIVFAEWPKWYAVMVDLDDSDWGTGSHDLAEATAIAKAMRANGNNDAYIAIVDEIGNVCLDEIHDF